MSDDRTVHATNGPVEIVRYDRASRWYVEDKRTGKRTVTTPAGAALRAVRNNYEIALGLPGGTTFDREVRKLR